MLFRAAAIFMNLFINFLPFFSPGNLEGGQGHRSKLKTGLKPQRR